MKYMKWIGLLSVTLLIISCFTPWVFIESKNIIVSGIDSSGTNFGKPGYIHFILSFFFLVFHFIPKIWAKRWNLLIVALNLAWVIRNYFIITACRDGECPEKQIGIYLVLISSGLLMLSAMFPDVKMKEEKNPDNS